MLKLKDLMEKSPLGQMNPLRIPKPAGFGALAITVKTTTCYGTSNEVILRSIRT
jgi:hypothetical protein